MSKNGSQVSSPKPDAPGLQLVLVRHGQSLSNRDGPTAGDDSGLTELGWRQAKATADWLAAHYHVDRLVASPQRRARQTAQVIAQRCGSAVRIQPGLEETPSPYWQEFPPIPADQPLAHWDFTWTPDAASAPTYVAFKRRIHSALEELLAIQNSGTLVIVTHSGTIATIVRGLIGGHNMSLVTENGAITQLSWQGGVWRLVFHNCQSHLSALLPTNKQQLQEATEPPVWESDAQIERVVTQFARVARNCPVDVMPLRDREVLRLIRFARITAQDQILDVGAGSGGVSCAIAAEAGSVIGVDVTPAMLECAEQTRAACHPGNVQFHWAEAAALPFPEESFSMVLCRDLLPYLAHPADALASFRRVLRKTGRLVLDELVGSDDPVKRATQETIEIRRDPSFIAALSVRDLERLLRDAGFGAIETERYEVTLRLDDWLSLAAADSATSAAVRSMLEASLVGDAAGLNVRQARDGSITLVQQRVRMLAPVEKNAISTQ